MNKPTIKSIKTAILTVLGRNRLDISNITQEDLAKVCATLGFKVSPYLIVEAHLFSCGGFATEGKGPFDPEKLLEWIKKREAKILPVKSQPTQSQELSPMRAIEKRYNMMTKS